jgi:hypothetical protein
MTSSLSFGWPSNWSLRKSKNLRRYQTDAPHAKNRSFALIAMPPDCTSHRPHLFGLPPLVSPHLSSPVQKYLLETVSGVRSTKGTSRCGLRRRPSISLCYRTRESRRGACVPRTLPRFKCSSRSARNNSAHVPSQLPSGSCESEHMQPTMLESQRHANYGNKTNV